MPGNAVALGPFSGGLHNSAGTGEAIDNKELFELINLEVDLDQSLANRPAIGIFNTAGLTSSDGIRVLGRYTPADGRNFIVAATASTVMLINAATGIQAVSQAMQTITVVQSVDRLYCAPYPGSGTTGGYFSVSAPGATPAWTAVATLPAGEAMVSYKDRLYVAAGINSIANTSRLYYSWALDGTQWNNVGGNSASGGFVDVDPGNGQKLVSMTVLNNDIILFKQHSSYRYSFTSIPSKADLFPISSTVGVPAPGCAVTYDNNNVYLMHDNNVYELYNYSFQSISKPIALSQTVDNSLYAQDIYGLTLYRDRLFVRYYANMYVYSLKTKTWAKWVSTRKFSRIVSVPSADIGLDTAYASTASSDNPGKLYYFRDDRVAGVGTIENFTCKVTTKTYDLDLPWAFKVLMYWGLSIATSGNTTGTVVVPNSGQNYTWGFMKANYTWGSAKAAGIPWSSVDKTLYSRVIPPALGKYAKKYLKYPKKLRFRQCSFSVTTDAIANTIGDASVRIYDITAFILQKETVVKETS